MLEDFPATPKPALPIVGRELLALAVSGLLYPFGLRKSSGRTRRAREQRTVVLVHGYLANRSCFLPLRGWLRARGIKQVLSYEYSGRDGIEQAAIGLREFLRGSVRGGRIDLVCHSLGGLVARVYLQELGGARRVDRCITLATPHRGTYNAYWVNSRIGRELRPDSALLARLAASRAGAARVRFSSIAGESDNIVLPRVFAADEDLVRVGAMGHLGLLFSPTVLEAVAQRLVAPAA
jgi:pimeloyl-ACP methyl ester carboxylesterase